MKNETILAEMISVGQVDFTRPAGVQSVRYRCHNTYMNKFYIHDMYCASNENMRTMDPIQRPY